MGSSRLPVYWTDPLKVKATINILEIEGEKITVQDLLFYPEGGGQESDQGELVYNNEVIAEVLHVRRPNSGTILEVKWKNQEAIPNPPFAVEARIGLDRRRSLMRAHTGQHLVSALFEERGYETTKAEIHPDEFLIELDRDFSDQELPLVIEKANRIVVEGKEVISRFLSPQEALDFQTRTPLKKTEEKVLRIVEIEDTDTSFCGGTHASNTNEIGSILLTNYGKKFFRFVVGYKASEMLNRLTNHLLLAGEQVATSPNHALEVLLQSFKSLKDENRRINLCVQNFVREVIATARDIFLEDINDRPVLILTSLPITRKQIGKIVDELKKSEAFIVATSDNILLVESNEDKFARVLFDKLKEALGVKGGGGKGKYALRLETQIDRERIVSILAKM